MKQAQAGNVRERDGVEHDHLLQARVRNAFVGLAAEQAVGSERVHPSRCVNNNTTYSTLVSVVISTDD